MYIYIIITTTSDEKSDVDDDARLLGRGAIPEIISLSPL